MVTLKENKQVGVTSVVQLQSRQSRVQGYVLRVYAELAAK